MAVPLVGALLMSSSHFLVTFLGFKKKYALGGLLALGVYFSPYCLCLVFFALIFCFLAVSLFR